MILQKKKIQFSALPIALLIILQAGLASPDLRLQNGQLKGTVRNHNDVPVKDARIFLVTSGSDCTVFSDEKGEFIVNVPAGTYQVTIEKTGFVKAFYGEVKIRADAENALAVQLNEPHIRIDPSPDEPHNLRRKVLLVPSWFWRQFKRMFR